MTTEAGQGAAPAGTPPGTTGTAAPASGAPAPWYADEYKDLVTAKGWKDSNSALKSYTDLEKFVGAPADRLLRLPEKADDPSWPELRAKVGWKAPDTPDAYGIKPAQGLPDDYAKAMASAFHKAGVPADVVQQIVKANDEFAASFGKTAMEAENKAIADRITAADADQAKRFGANLPKMQEGMLREALRLGIKADELPELEKDLAANDRLGIFRSMLGDLAELRAEGSVHNDGNRGITMTPEQAKATLETKSKDSEWVTKAFQRGTTEAEENLRLNAAIAGVVLSPEEIKRQASGLGASA